MVKKWCNARITVPTINKSVTIVAKQLTGAFLLFNITRGVYTVDLSASQKECTIKIGMTWHEILIIII